MTTATIAAQGVGVRFRFDRQRRVVTSTLARLRRRGTETWGIRDVTFALAPGDAVALVGASGSGKTTLLRTLAGVLCPDAGRLLVRGRVASLLSVDAGLTPALTGRENALLLGVLAGMPRSHIRRALDELRDWTALGDAFDRPISSYSQGMRARLSFAIAMQAMPSILLLDEVHEALDHDFRELVEAEAHRLLRRGGMLVAAGHDHPLLERLCNRGLWLHEGSVAADGTFDDVRRAYVP
ncbi:MAG TPA: ATP-binding cassette domain-containing protein [Gaiellaceae bacterium]|jgi:ABC-2 type transport system ATP-binding protein|nr:ATP-binding cassette domain-containing protein [Gaiellaceae bacterium]